MKSFYITIFSFSLLIMQYPLYGEVEKVVVKWLPGTCTESCLRDLEYRLRSIPDVAEIKFQGSANQATLRWRPNRQFSYTPINNAFRFVGVNLHEIFVTTRGTIASTRREVALKSLGDGAEFTLLSPIKVTPGQAPASGNVQSYALREETRERLVQAENIYQLVTVEGRLFEPERSPPLKMIIERLEIPTPWEKVDKSSRRR